MPTVPPLHAMVSPAPSSKPARRVAKRYSLAQIPQGEAALRALARYGYLLNPQLALLLFAGEGNRTFQRAWDVCNRQCLAPLLKQKWIERVPVQHDHWQTGNNFQDRANLLTPAGAKQLNALATKYGLPETVKPRSGLKRRLYNRKLDHKLAIRDAAIVVEAACRVHGWGSSHWLDDADFRAAQQRRAIKMTNQPDGFCLVTAGSRRCPLFFEVDRKREPTASLRSPETAWRARIASYGAYFAGAYLTDPFWPALGLPPGEMVRPLVLTVTEDAAHVGRQLDATRAAGGRGTYWYAAWPDVRAAADPAKAPIWRVTISHQPRWLAGHFEGKRQG